MRLRRLTSINAVHDPIEIMLFVRETMLFAKLNSTINLCSKSLYCTGHSVTNRIDGFRFQKVVKKNAGGEARKTGDLLHCSYLVKASEI